MANSSVKVTRSSVLTKVIENNGSVTLSAEELQVLRNIKASVERKSTSSKPTKTQVENEAIKEVILETLATIGSGTVTTIIKSNEKLADYSNQKISALMTLLINEGKVDKKTEKKVSTFTLV